MPTKLGRKRSIVIYLTGDLHGDFRRLSPERFREQEALSKEDILLACGDFGGVWYGDERDDEKLERHIDTGAEYITGADCSCLMHLAGIAAREGRGIPFRHVVEILAEGL